MMAALLVIGLVVVGLALLAAEILIIPGFGVIGALGAIAVAGAGYVAFTEISPAYSAATIAAGVVAAGLMFWLLPKTKMIKGMVLTTQTVGTAAKVELQQLVGRVGEAVSDLRPSGSVEIDERPVDVVTDGEYVESGTKVRVVRVEGARVIVERLS